jgi:hypothetical protein
MRAESADWTTAVGWGPLRLGRGFGRRPLPEPGARWEDRRGPAVDGVNDFAAVDSFEVDAGDAKVGVPELALDDNQWYALRGHLDRVRVAELMRGEAPTDAGGRREVAEYGSSGCWRPGSSGRGTADDAEQRADGHVQAALHPLA